MKPFDFDKVVGGLNAMCTKSEDKKLSEQEVLDALGGDEDKIAQIDEFAQGLAIEDDAIETLDAELKRRKEEVDAAKAQLCTMLREAGMQSCKLECGLNPAAVTNMKYYPVGGINTEEFHDWLRRKDLADIIKETVHFQTLQSTLKEFVAQGNKIPEAVCKESTELTIRMNGKSKFLAERKE